MQEQRRTDRIDCDLPATLSSNAGGGACQIRNISPLGLSATIDPLLSLANGQKVSVSHSDLGVMAGTVRWLGMGKFGMEFTSPVGEAELLAATS